MVEDKEIERDIPCSHVKVRNFPIYRAIVLDERVLLLCRACYGEVMTQILDNLKEIKVKLK